MRKTRLVILPTKCLHQMGFLLLFLSCPVIGDWGRIRPESEDSHNAIQIDREGTCGFERDPPGGIVDYLNEIGSKQCRLNKDLNSNTPAKSVERVIKTTKSGERHADVRRVNHMGSEYMLERRMINERSARKTIQRRMTDERRNARRVVQGNVRNDVRSRSVESRGSSSNRNYIQTRSLSLSRLENERVARSIRNQNNKRSLGSSEKLHFAKQRTERQNERKIDQQRRLARELSNERRENERTIRAASERRERETRRTVRRISEERERQDVRRENNRRSIQEQSFRRHDLTRRQTQEKTQNIRRETKKRLSLARREQNDATRAERFESRRLTEQINLERRVPEIRKTRSLESEGRKSDQRENIVRNTRSFDSRREVDNKRLQSLSLTATERQIRERRANLATNEWLESTRPRRMTSATIRKHQNDVREVNPSIKNAEENFTEGVTKWFDLKSYDNYKAGDWTTNCVIGAVVYYLTTRQIKSV